MPVGIGNFRSLQELDLGMGTIESYENFGMEVGKLTELRMLNIKGIDEGKWKALIESVFMLPRIQKLEISFFSLGKMITWDGWDHWEPSRQLQQLSINGICLPRLPVWMNSICIPHLSCMDLKVSTIEASDLDVIARLPALCSLCLYIQQRFLWTVPGGGLFPNLRFCDTNIALTFLHGAIPILTKIKLRLLVSKNDVPHDVGLGNLPLLHTIVASIDCSGATARQVEDAEVALRRAVHAHPNHPAIYLDRYRKVCLVN